MPIRVLVVDDNAEMRRQICTILNTDSMLEIIGEAQNGEEALEKALTLLPNVVIMDTGMPVLDGIEATRRIRCTCPRIAVIGCSTDPHRIEASQSHAAGAKLFLATSEFSKSLVTAVHAMVNLF